MTVDSDVEDPLSMETLTVDEPILLKSEVRRPEYTHESTYGCEPMADVAHESWPEPTLILGESEVASILNDPVALRNW